MSENEYYQKIGFSSDGELDGKPIKPSTINAVIAVLNNKISGLDVDAGLKRQLRLGVMYGFVGVNGVLYESAPIEAYLPDTIGGLKKCLADSADHISMAGSYYKAQLEEAESPAASKPAATVRYLSSIHRAIFDAFNAALTAEGLTPVARTPRSRREIKNAFQISKP